MKKSSLSSLLAGWKTLGFFGLLLALRLASSETAALSFFLLAGYAFRGRSQAIHALILGWLFVMINSTIAPYPPAVTLLRYIVLISAAASVFFRSGFRLNRAYTSRPVLFALLLGIFIVVHSFIVSPEPTVSVLKGASWTITFITSASAWAALRQDQREKLAEEVYRIILVVAGLSLLLVPTSQGYMIRGGGGLFQGFLNHSQALGSTLALLVAWTLALYFERARWRYLIYLMFILPLIFLTGTRTALLACFLGVAASLLLTPMLSGLKLRAVAPAFWGGKFWGAVTVGLMASIVMIETISMKVAGFINKGREFGSVLQAYEDSRGGLIERMVANVYDHPFLGIGFGIASNPNDFVVERVFGIPVSAAVEKGITPIAIVEELGLPGAVLAMVWIGCVILEGARSGLAPLAVIGTILALNMAEATLFSPGGMGMLMIVLLGWAMSDGSFRKQAGKTQ